jgi:hypothetical protein
MRCCCAVFKVFGELADARIRAVHPGPVTLASGDRHPPCRVLPRARSSLAVFLLG